MTYAQMCASTHIFEKTIYDPKKFSIIARFVRAKYISAVPKNAPYRSIDDLKKSDRPIRVGGSNVSSAGSIASFALADEVGFPATHVLGYKGAAGTIIGALRGENDFVTYGAVLKPYLERGDLIPLIFFDFERSKQFPEVPTLKDFGLPEYLEILGGLDYVIWGPPGIPEDRLQILEKAVLKATEENRENFRKRWMFPSPLPSKETKQRVFSVYDKYVKYGGAAMKGYKR
jgi:tripartite-type tricarboxylate transporter receptor subunit TctC